MATKIWVVSGEGEVGTREPYTGPLTVRALKNRLAKESAGGDRWTHCEVETDERHAERCTPEDAIVTAGGRLSPGDSTHVQFRCAQAVRLAVLSRAESEGLTEREAWEAAGRAWADGR